MAPLVRLRANKKIPGKILILIIAAIVLVFVARTAYEWFLHKAKDVAIERTNKSLQQPQKAIPPKEPASVGTP